ncbi:MAG TPA: hypothetical protein VHQ91_06780 [Geminicoccaceae bacterium]|nr:hypothetical protein [Geminicoccaceae bacterium]
MAHPPLHVIPGTPAGGRARLWEFWQARAGLGAWLATRLLEENTRWILWLPLGLGLGIGVYFALPIEPPVWLGPIALLAPAAAVGLRWRGGRPVAAELAVWFGLGTIVLGFAAGSVRSHLVAAPVLERRGAYQLEATVLLVEDGTRGSAPFAGGAEYRGHRGERDPGSRQGQHTPRGAVL